MEFTDKLVERYTRRILGYAYTKTRDAYKAEDLSQEILLQLVGALQRHDNIDDLDGYVYSICQFTWAKSLRKAKQQSLTIGLDAAWDIAADTNVEKDVETKLLSDRLRHEIAYLAEAHRRITVMYYYDGLTGREIALKLGLPPGTIRWHLGVIRKKLQGGMEMTESPIYAPQRMNVGIHGNGNDDGTMGGTYLGDDLLADNIALACYGTPLTVEEIARKLTVAAPYIENNLKRLTRMDYVRVVDKNRYQTTFFISSPRNSLFAVKYALDNIAPYAKRIWDVFEQRFSRILGIGFIGADLDKNFVRWALLPYVVNSLIWGLPYSQIKRPKRADGSEHFCIADIVDDDYRATQSEFAPDVVQFEKDIFSNGIKSFGYNTQLRGWQVENRFTKKDAGLHWRNFDDPDLAKIEHIANIQLGSTDTSGLDKLTIAKYIEDGYVEMRDNKPRLLIPYFNAIQSTELFEIFAEIRHDELGNDFFVPYMEGFAELFEREIPTFLSKEVREFHKYNEISPTMPVLMSLYNQGLLQRPTKDEAPRLATFVWRGKG